MRKPDEMKCPLCCRSVWAALLTEHHTKLKRRDSEAKVFLCRECHQVVHGFYPDTMLARRPDLWTIEGLRADADIMRGVAHVRKLAVGTSMRMKERKRR